jgi:hypothetical protein
MSGRRRDWPTTPNDAAHGDKHRMQSWRAIVAADRATMLK